MRIREIINEAPDDNDKKKKYKTSGFGKDVHPSYYEKWPQYTGGAWFTNVRQFHDHLMDPKSYYHKKAVRSPQHPVTGKPDLRFKMPDKRIANDPNFKARYVAALGTAPTQAIATTKKPSTILDPNRGGLSTADITKPQPTAVASTQDPQAQKASTQSPPDPQNVPPMPKAAGRAGIVKQNQWKQKYGKTHNPDGTPKQ